MKQYSQQHLEVAATEPEHVVRKNEFDDVIGILDDLQTQNKTNLVMAINEIHATSGGGDEETGKTAVALAVGPPASSSDSFTQLTDHIQDDKTGLAAFLSGRGVAASHGESLAALVAKLDAVARADTHPYKYRLLTLTDFPNKSTSDPNVAEGRYNNGSLNFPGWTPILCFVDGSYWTSTGQTNYQIRGGFWLAWNPTIFGSADHVATSTTAGDNTFKSFSEIHNDGNITSNPGAWAAGSSTYIMYQNNAVTWAVGSLAISKVTRSANFAMAPKFCLSAWRKTM